MTASRYVLFDRDGVLNVNYPHEYVISVEQLILLPGAAEAVAQLNRAGFEIVVVSNQQCVGKGLISEHGILELTEVLRERIRQESGGEIREFFYCYDLADSGSTRRKPAPGMLLEAQEKYGFELAETYMVGDSYTDLEAAERAGCPAILVLSGLDGARYLAGEHPSAKPAHVAKDLLAAVPHILNGREL